MPPFLDFTDLLAAVTILAPVALLAVLGLTSLLQRPLPESAVHRACQIATVAGLAAGIGILATMLAIGSRQVTIDAGEWVSVPGFHFSVKFVFDRLSTPFALLSFVLCGTIGAFAARYLHREPGYHRFFVLYAIFLAGMVTAALAGTIEVLFAGWEMVGLSSALLVAFFHDRLAPPRNGYRVWVVYRLSDAALLLAAVVTHRLTGQGDFAHCLGPGPWPEGQAILSANQSLIVGLLLLIAAAGKSALIPFSGWLPRAMEGPTPSSAVFYGALSVHLGAFLLLRAGTLLDASMTLAACVFGLGLATAIYAYLVASVQTDIKSALSFASLSQVGLIVAEIGLGFRYLALIHLLGHACLRTLQFLRAPTLLHDYHRLENAIGERLPRTANPWDRLTDRRLLTWLYRFALERGYLDLLLMRFVERPFRGFFLACDRLERRCARWLAGSAGAIPVRDESAILKIEEVP
jgi:NAD(P)H-quinone oxidoreductase subunit 5